MSRRRGAVAPGLDCVGDATGGNLGERWHQSEYNVAPYDFGDLMTVDDFRTNVATGLFIDYDGSGHPMKGGMMSRQAIYPSRVNEIPEDATHILWFNK